MAAMRCRVVLGLMLAFAARAAAQGPPTGVEVEPAGPIYVDDEGGLVDAMGLPVDEFGTPLSDEGVPVDANGKPADISARLRAQHAAGGTAPSSSRSLKGKPKAKPAVLPRSAFEFFVHAATGREVPLFGLGPFAGDDAIVPVSESAPVPADYAIGPGDEIILKVTGIRDLRSRLVVDREGRITIPKVGTVSIMGVRAAELEPFLEKQFARSFRNFTLSASLGALRSMEIYVVGQAARPGRHGVPGVPSLVHAMLLTGGPGSNGGLRRVQLVRSGTVAGELDFYEFMRTGKAAGDVRLMPGDAIVYPPAGPRVALVGDINNPAIFELRQADEPLDEVLQAAGGLPITIDRRRASIERINPAQNPPRSVTLVTLDDEGRKTPLRDGDIINLMSATFEFKDAVTLRGNVATPLRHPWQKGMRVRDLIPDRDALLSPDYFRKKSRLVLFEDKPPPKAKRGEPNPTPEPRPMQQPVTAESVQQSTKDLLAEINWEYAVVERVDPVTLKPTLKPFHLGKAVLQGDAEQNLELLAGDVVTIFSSKELGVPQAHQTRLVRIEGEVGAPGLYQIEPGETLTALLRRLGGTTGQAYLYGTSLRRENLRKAQRATLNAVVRQLEDEVRAHIAKRLANLPASGDPAQMAAIQSQLQVEERYAMGRIQQLRNTEPEGRVSLEMSPEHPELPDVLLEDGDAIFVPARPSFISVVGAVHNENGVLWREGRTVANYLDVVGTRPNADLDNLYVLRADGSVRSRDRGFFSWVPGQNHGLQLEPGDVVIVPERLELESGYTVLVRGLKDWTQILANMGIAVATVTLLVRQ